MLQAVCRCLLHLELVSDVDLPSFWRPTKQTAGLPAFCAGRCCNRATTSKEFRALLDRIHKTTSRAPYAPTISLHVALSSAA